MKTINICENFKFSLFINIFILGLTWAAFSSLSLMANSYFTTMIDVIRSNDRGVSKKCASVWERMWSTTSYVVFFIFPFLPVCVCTGPAVSVCATHCRAQSAHKEKGAVRGGVEAKERVKLKKRKERAEGGGTVQCAEVCMSSEGFQLSQTIVGGKALCMTIGSLTPVKLAGGVDDSVRRRREGVPICLRGESVYICTLRCVDKTAYAWVAHLHISLHVFGHFSAFQCFRKRMHLRYRRSVSLSFVVLYVFTD